MLSIEEVAGWVTGQVWTKWTGKEILPLPGLELDSSVAQPVAHRYTDYPVPEIKRKCNFLSVDRGESCY